MKHLHTFDPIDWRNVDLVEVKYKPISRKLLDSLDPRVRTIVEKMLSYEVPYKYDNCLLDVKIRDLYESQFSCALRSFHYDWVKDYDELPIQHETHFIYTNVNGTVFKEGGKCIDNSIYTYGRELHRGVDIQEDVTRVLIRLSYVNKKQTVKK